MSGNLVPGRECGECSVCCETLTINTPALTKLPDVLYAHRVKPAGCGIYDLRPPNMPKLVLRLEAFGMVLLNDRMMGAVLSRDHPRIINELVAALEACMAHRGEAITID